MTCIDLYMVCTKEMVCSILMVSIWSFPGTLWSLYGLFQAPNNLYTVCSRHLMVSIKNGLFQASHHSVNGQFMGPPDNPFLLTAGSDMRIRYWDLGCPNKSHLLVPAAGDPVNQTVISYRSVNTDHLNFFLSNQNWLFT